MKHRIFLCISVVLSIVLLIGCGEKEDKDILEARLKIATGDYTAAGAAVQKALASESGKAEAQSLQALLQLRSGTGWKTDAATWQAAMQKVLSHLLGESENTLNVQIQYIETLEDPDSDELDRLERLVRSRNSISGLLATSLAEAVKQDAGLLSGLVAQPDAVVITALLEAEKCFQSASRQAATGLIQQLSTNTSAHHLLAEATRHSDAKIRKQAVRHLGGLKMPEFIPVFESILHQKAQSPDVLYNTIVALEQQKGEAIVGALQLATQTNSAQIRLHAAKLLGQLKSEKSIDTLIRLLADSNSYVKNAAIQALTEIGEPAIQPLIAVLDSQAQDVIPDRAQNLAFIADYEYIANAYIDEARLESRRVNTQAAVNQVLGALKAESAISRLIALLADDDLHSSASAALVTMAGAAVPTLITALQNEPDDIRIKVAEALGTIRDRRTINPFIEALKNDSRKEIQAVAAKTLGDMRAHGPNNSAIDPLIQALDLDDTTATNAATALGQIGVSTDEGIKKLIAIAMDKKERETKRIAALTALGQLKSTEAVQPMMLLVLSDETSPIIRKESVTALGEIKDTNTVPMLLWVLSTQYDDIKDFQRHMKRKYKTLSALEKAIDSLSIEWLSEYPQPDYQTWGELKSIPSLVRSEVAITLGKIKGDEVVQPLIKALKDDGRAAVRKSVAWALGEIKGDAVIDPLIRALKKDKQGIVRQESAVALGKIKGDKVVAPLLTALKKDKFETTRKQAAIALRELPPKLADDGLLDVLRKGVGSFEEGHEVESIQTEVIASLIKGGAELTTKLLLNALESEDDKWIRWKIVHVLGAIKHKSSIDAIVQELNHPNEVVRRSAAASLGGYKDRKTVDTLIQVLENRDEYKSIRARAAASLGVLLDERAVAPLLAALNDENAEVRANAAVALGSLKDANAVDKLIELALNPLEDATVRANCVTALGLLGHSNAETALLNILRTETDIIYKNAIVALGRMKSTKAVPELIAILEDKRIDLDASTDALAKASARTKAATALAQIEDARGAKAMADRLVDDTEYIVAIHEKLKRNWSWEVFANAAKSFRLPAYVAPKMQERIDSTWEDQPIRSAAAVVLEKCDVPGGRSDAVQNFRQLLTDEKKEVRQAAAKNVGEAKVVQLKEDLVKMMKGETEIEKDVRRGATQGLGELGDVATVPALIETFNNEDNHIEIRRDAAVALGKIGTDAAVSALIERLQPLQEAQTNKNLRLDIVKALGQIKDQKAVTLLKTVLEDEDADIHFHAADALFQITGDGHGYNRVSITN